MKTKFFLFILVFFLSNSNALTNNFYIVILAGGKGERLWPLSRESRPKQLLPFNGKSLLEHTLERVQHWIPQENIWIITNTNQYYTIADLLGTKVGNIISEPASRNTAAAILLATMQIHKQNPNATVAFLPADHVIDPLQEFAESLEEALLFTSEHDKIALLGLKPTFPATGYGYIEYTIDRTTDIAGPYKVVKFHEKPSKDLAQFYSTSAHMLWNMGIFCAQTAFFIDEFNYHAPELVAQMNAYLDGTFAYEDFENISVDYVVMEKSKSTVVFPVQFAWSDVGNLDIFLSLQKKSSVPKDKLITVDAKNNILDVQDKLVALVGVDNICVVQTDDVLLVAKRDEVEKVKEVVKELKSKKRVGYL